MLTKEKNTLQAIKKDIILAVNKKLERTKVPKKFRASKITYFKERLISILFIEKVDAEKLYEE